MRLRVSSNLKILLSLTTRPGTGKRAGYSTHAKPNPQWVRLVPLAQIAPGDLRGQPCDGISSRGPGSGPGPLDHLLLGGPESLDRCGPDECVFSLVPWRSRSAALPREPRPCR